MVSRQRDEPRSRWEFRNAPVPNLVRRQVALILTMPTAAALAAKTATSNIPVVFLIAVDPVQIGWQEANVNVFAIRHGRHLRIADVRKAPKSDNKWVLGV